MATKMDTPFAPSPIESLNGLDRVLLAVSEPTHTFLAYQPRFDTANPHLLWVTREIDDGYYERVAIPMARVHSMKNPARTPDREVR